MIRSGGDGVELGLPAFFFPTLVSAHLSLPSSCLPLLTPGVGGGWWSGGDVDSSGLVGVDGPGWMDVLCMA